MTAVAAANSEPALLVACTISRDIGDFDLLVEDMEAELGAGWGDVSLSEAARFLAQPEAQELDFIAIAMDHDDTGDASLEQISAVVTAARQADIPVILVAEEVGPAALHQLLRLGANDFLPYPLPKGALHEAIARLSRPAPAPAAVERRPDATVTGGNDRGRDGSVLAVHGLAGGVGATTFVTNLAWELATPDSSRKDPTPPPDVCIIDLDLQFGSVATYLDLPRREAVYELLSDMSRMDADSFTQALETFQNRLHVLTAPADMLPLDFVTGEDITRLIDIARKQFDFVIIDMPSSVVSWTEAVLNEAHVYFSLLELEMRSAQNTLRMLRALKAESLPVEKLRFALNRAPKFTDVTGRSRLKRLSESLDISVEILLPDGKAAVTDANDHGQPLALTGAKKSPLRREIRKLAEKISEVSRARRAEA